MTINCTTNPLHKHCILGVNTSVAGIHLLDDDKVLYSCGIHVVIWHRHDKKQIVLHQCTSSEVLQQIALCPNRRLIGIAVQKPDGPQVILYDGITLKRKKSLRHVDDIGNILSISFSKDSKQCLILGDAPNFLLSAWSIEKVPKVTASIRLATPSGKRSNRADLCSTDAKMACASGNGILRFFKIVDKIFRPVTVNLRREQQNYLFHCWLPDGQVVLGTDSNELIVIDNCEVQSVVSIENWDQSISAMESFSKGVLVGGSSGTVRVYTMTQADRIHLTMTKAFKSSDSSEIKAIARSPTEEFFICMNNAGKIWSFPLTHVDMLNANEENENTVVPTFHRPNSNGENAILCMDICLWKPIVVTGGCDRTVRIWNYETSSVQLVQNCDSDILSISLHPSSLQILIGFEKYTRIDFVHQENLSNVWRSDISTNGSSNFSSGGAYFALGIGPYVQVYDAYTYQTLCILRGHSSTVRSICWKSNDQQIGTIGEDGAICIWATSTGKRIFRHAFPSCSFESGYFSSNFEKTFLSTSDRNIKIINISNLLEVVDKDIIIPESIILMEYNCQGNLLVGTIDGTLHQGDVWLKNLSINGWNEVVHQTNHSKPITCMRLSANCEYLMTASEDGSLCITTINSSFPTMKRLDADCYRTRPFQDVLVPNHELKQMNECISSLHQEVEKTKQANKAEIDELTSSHLKTLMDWERQIKKKKETSGRILKVKTEELSNLQEQNTKELQSSKEKHLNRITVMKRMNEKDTQKEKQRLNHETRRHEEEIKEKIVEIDSLVAEQQVEIKVMKENHERLMIEEHRKISSLSKEKKIVITKHRKEIEKIEEDADIELSSLMRSHEIASNHEIKTALLLKEENDIMKKKYEALLKDHDEQKETILSLEEKQSELASVLSEQENIKKSLSNRLLEQDDEMSQLDDRINEITEQTYEMEKRKEHQSNKIQQLKNDFVPKEEELNFLRETKELIEDDLAINHRRNEELRTESHGRKLRLSSLKKEVKMKEEEVLLQCGEISNLEIKLNEASKLTENLSSLKKHLIDLYHNTIGNQAGVSLNEDGIKSSDERECDYLKKKIKSTEDIMERQKRTHTNNIKRLRRERKILLEQYDEVTQEEQELIIKQTELMK